MKVARHNHDIYSQKEDKRLPKDMMRHRAIKMIISLTKLCRIILKVIDQVSDDVLDESCGSVALPVRTEEESTLVLLLCHQFVCPGCPCLF